MYQKYKGNSHFWNRDLVLAIAFCLNHFSPYCIHWLFTNLLFFKIMPILKILVTILWPKQSWPTWSILKSCQKWPFWQQQIWPQFWLTKLIGVCTVIFISNPTTVLRFCCVVLSLGLWQNGWHFTVWPKFRLSVKTVPKKVIPTKRKVTASMVLEILSFVFMPPQYWG